MDKKLLEEALKKLEDCYAIAGDLDDVIFPYEKYRDLKTTIDKITAALSAPQPDAMEILRQVRQVRVEDRCKHCNAPEGLHNGNTNQCPWNGREALLGKDQRWADTTWEPATPYYLPDSEAASLIEDFGKRVPRAWEELSDAEREPYFNKAVYVLQDHYTCTRVWSAWSYGTMTQDDFHLAAEDDDIVSDTAKMLYDFEIADKFGVKVEG